MVAPSKRNCRISQRIARAPQTRPRGAHPLVMFQEYRRLAGVFATYPASLKPPEPCRDPGPGRVDHLHHHAPVALCDHPTTRAASTAITGLYVEHQSIWGASHAHQMEALQTDEQITPNTTVKRHTAAAGRARHRPRSLKAAGVEVCSSSRISTSTRNPRSTPTHPHSTRKSRFDRGPGSARGRLRHVRARVAAPEDERIKRDGQGPARPGRSAPRTHAPRPRGGGGARRGACAPRSRHPCVTRSAGDS